MKREEDFGGWLAVPVSQLKASFNQILKIKWCLDAAHLPPSLKGETSLLLMFYNFPKNWNYSGFFFKDLFWGWTCLPFCEIIFPFCGSTQRHEGGHYKFLEHLGDKIIIFPLSPFILDSDTKMEDYSVSVSIKKKPCQSSINEIEIIINFFCNALLRQKKIRQKGW